MHSNPFISWIGFRHVLNSLASQHSESSHKVRVCQYQCCVSLLCVFVCLCASCTRVKEQFLQFLWKLSAGITAPTSNAQWFNTPSSLSHYHTQTHTHKHLLTTVKLPPTERATMRNSTAATQKKKKKHKPACDHFPEPASVLLSILCNTDFTQLWKYRCINLFTKCNDQLFELNTSQDITADISLTACMLADEWQKKLLNRN